MPPLRPESPNISSEDLASAATIRAWLEGRQSERVAWKKLSSLAAAFGTKRLTQELKDRMTAALVSQGIELSISLNELGREDTVVLQLVRRKKRSGRTQAPNPATSDQLPAQLYTWHQSNITEEAFLDNKDGGGQFLGSLKETPQGTRQFIWEGSSGRGIVGVVTFSGGRPRRVGRGYQQWGRFTPLPAPVSRAQLLANPATQSRFDARGIRALQGSPIRLSETEATAIAKMAGGLGPTMLPSLHPDKSEPRNHWQNPRKLPPEAFTEAIIHADAWLWRELGIQGQPERQKGMKGSGRVDLVWRNTVIEVKKAVMTHNGADQIQRYLTHLAKELGLPPSGVRGILVQQEENVPPGVRDQLTLCPFPLELWAVHQNEEGEWQAMQLVP